MKPSKNFQILPKITKKRIDPENISLGFITGKNASGKTFIMLQMLKSFYEQGLRCAFVSSDMKLITFLEKFEMVCDTKKLKNHGSIIFAYKRSRESFFNFLQYYEKYVENTFDVVFIDDFDNFAKQNLELNNLYRRRVLVEKFQGDKYIEPSDYSESNKLINLQRYRREFLTDLRIISLKLQTKFFGSLNSYNSVITNRPSVPIAFLYEASFVLNVEKLNSESNRAVITCHKNIAGDANFSVNIPLIPKK